MEKCHDNSIRAEAIAQDLGLIKSDENTIITGSELEDMPLEELVDIALQVFLVYTPVGQAVVNTTAVSPFEWLFFVPFALLLFVAEEGRKASMRRMEKVGDADML